MGLIAKKYLKFCPCCEDKEGKGESLEHPLIDCKRWKDHREQCMGAVLSMIADMAVGSKEEKMILLLGGEYNGGRVAQWLPRSTDSETITCCAFQVARFLRCIRSERVTVLHQIKHKDLGIGDLQLVGWMS